MNKSLEIIEKTLRFITEDSMYDDIHFPDSLLSLRKELIDQEYQVTRKILEEASQRYDEYFLKVYHETVDTYEKLKSSGVLEGKSWDITSEITLGSLDSPGWEYVNSDLNKNHYIPLVCYTFGSSEENLILGDQEALGYDTPQDTWSGELPDPWKSTKTGMAFHHFYDHCRFPLGDLCRVKEFNRKIEVCFY